MTQTFKNYLRVVHCRENPEILDDDLPDHFESWMVEQDIEDLFCYADEYAIQVQKELLGKIKLEKKDDPWAYGFNIDMTDGYNQAIDEVAVFLETLKKSLLKSL